jgi:hypothetical protein
VTVLDFCKFAFARVLCLGPCDADDADAHLNLKP